MVSALATPAAASRSAGASLAASAIGFQRFFATFLVTEEERLGQKQRRGLRRAVIGFEILVAPVQAIENVVVEFVPFRIGRIAGQSSGAR